MRKIIGAVLMFLLALNPYTAATEEFSTVGDTPVLEVHFIDVEVNDAIFLRCGDECAFIDSGAESYGQICVDYLKKQGVTKLKYYIGTHAHLDHIGGSLAVLTAFETENVIANSDYTLRIIQNRAKEPDEIRAISIPKYRTMTVNDEISLGAATIKCLAPKYIKSIANTLDMTENENSLILRVSLGEKSFVLTGDAQVTTFWNVVHSMPEELKCTVYKNAHHRGEAPALVMEVLEAEYVVFQTAANYLPTQTFIDQLRKMGSTVLITSSNHAGSTAFYTDGTTLRYESENQLEAWSLNTESLKMRVGATSRLSVTGFTGRNVDTLTWTTSDAAVACPDPVTGAIKAVGQGECVITAAAFDGSQRSVSVTVSK